jgi:serine protease Do
MMEAHKNHTRTLTGARRLLLVLVFALSLLIPLGTLGCAGAVDLSTTTTTVTSSTDTTPGLANTGDTTPSAETLLDSSTEIVSPAQIVAGQVSASVVNVRVEGVTVSPFFGQEQYEGVGSGIIYTSDGYILTNDHVVSLNGQPVDSVQVTLMTGEVLDATIVARDSANDLALLKIDKTGLLPVVFVDPSRVDVGDWAIAIGSPLDYRNTVTEGIVSGLDRDLNTGDPTSPQLTGLIQTDAAISPGNSGGGLFNANGELIGMPEAYLPASTGAVNIGFAIPAGKVADIAEELMAQGLSATHG